MRRDARTHPHTTASGSHTLAAAPTHAVVCIAKDKLCTKQVFDEVTEKILDTPDRWGQKKDAGVRMNPASQDDQGACAC